MARSWLAIKAPWAFLVVQPSSNGTAIMLDSLRKPTTAHNASLTHHLSGQRQSDDASSFFGRRGHSLSGIIWAQMSTVRLRARSATGFFSQSFKLKDVHQEKSYSEGICHMLSPKKDNMVCAVSRTKAKTDYLALSASVARSLTHLRCLQTWRKIGPLEGGQVHSTTKLSPILRLETS